MMEAGIVPEKTCGTCLYYDGHQSKCGNPDSPRMGDDMDEMHTCPCWTWIDDDEGKAHSGLLEE